MLLADGEFQPLGEPQLPERVCESERNTVSEAGGSGNLSTNLHCLSQHLFADKRGVGETSCGVEELIAIRETFVHFTMQEG